MSKEIPIQVQSLKIVNMKTGKVTISNSYCYNHNLPKKELEKVHKKIRQIEASIK